METARALEARCSVPFIFRAGVWKPRTSPSSFQGAGEEALAWLRVVKDTFGIPVATEVATPEHVEAALKAGIDYLWIGARTSANPIAVQALVASLNNPNNRNNLKGLLIKNPVNADAALWIGNIERLEKTGLPVQLFEYGSVKACNLVQEEKLDCALVNMDFYNIDQFNSHVLMEDSYVYCVGRNHRYAGEKEVTFEMLGDEKIILFNTDSVQNETVTARYRSMGLTPNVIAYTSQLYTILNFLRGGTCGALLYSALAVNPRDFVQIPISPEITSKFGVIWKKGIFIPERTNKFIEYIKKRPIIR